MPINSTIALTTVETVELVLGIATGQFTLQIERAINTYSALLEGLTGRKLLARDYTDYLLNGNGCQELYFPQYPLNSVDELEINDSLGNLYISIDPTDIEQFVNWSAIGKMILPQHVFLYGNQNVKITCNAGITDTAELLMLENAVLEMIAMSNPQGPLRPTNIKSERLGSYAVTFDTSSHGSSVTGLPSSIQNVIDYFSRI